MIRENLASLKVEDRATILHRASLGALGQLDADIYFLDPPYTEPAEYRSALDLLGERTLRPGALVLAQHAKRFELAESYGRLRRTRVRPRSAQRIEFTPA